MHSIFQNEFSYMLHVIVYFPLYKLKQILIRILYDYLSEKQLFIGWIAAQSREPTPQWAPIASKWPGPDTCRLVPYPFLWLPNWMVLRSEAPNRVRTPQKRGSAMSPRGYREDRQVTPDRGDKIERQLPIAGPLRESFWKLQEALGSTKPVWKQIELWFWSLLGLHAIRYRSRGLRTSSATLPSAPHADFASIWHITS